MKKKFRRESLAELFQFSLADGKKTDVYRGEFGIMCGYSADARFLNLAAERFTGYTEASRAMTGRCSLAVMLDPGNPQIAPTQTPGLVHLAMKTKPDFALLHAKVAVLGFKHETDQNRWAIRLIVSTGNWTSQTLEESLDLAFIADFRSEELSERTLEAKQSAIDISKGWDLLSWLTQYFDLRVIEGETNGIMRDAGKQQLASWVAQAGEIASRVKPRFIDNRSVSFVKQIPAHLRSLRIIKNSHLSMGSGFFESGAGQNKLPSVLQEIYDSLRKADLLTANPDVAVYVNPSACQGIADSFEAIKQAGWTIRRPQSPLYFNQNQQRMLHAKFLFSKKTNSEPNECSNVWIYLGSGNLTGPGFSSAAKGKGNLEAGVILTDSKMYITEKRGMNPCDVVSNILPICFEGNEITMLTEVAAGAEMSVRDEKFFAPPIPFVIWEQNAQRGLLKVSEPAKTSYQLIGLDGKPCVAAKVNEFVWAHSQPRQVEVQWREGDQIASSLIPVIDEAGGIATSSHTSTNLDEAWLQLMNFPHPPDDGDEGDGEPAEEGPTGIPKKSVRSGASEYPVRSMMYLIEKIAMKQTQIQEHDWAFWCARLSQCLKQVSQSENLQAFRKLRSNPIGNLKRPEFLPPFALSDPELLKRYENALTSIEQSWGVSEFSFIGLLA